MSVMILTGMASLWLAAENGGIESLSPIGQAGILGSMLVTFGVVIRVLFVQMVKSKDSEIAAANARAEAALARADRYEKKLDDQQANIQHEVLTALKDASNTTRRALEITHTQRRQT